MPLRRAVTMLSAVATAGCLVTNPVDFQPEAPVRRPFIRDIPGLTTPRLGNIVLFAPGANLPVFNIPVDVENVDETLQYQFIVDRPRDCADVDGGATCDPNIALMEIPPTGSVERVVTWQPRGLSDTVCHRVELWVSSAFLHSGDFHTPVRAGDVDFATWWLIPQTQSGSAPVDISTCQQLVASPPTP